MSARSTAHERARGLGSKLAPCIAWCLVLCVLAGQSGLSHAVAAAPATFDVQIAPTDVGQGDFVVISGTSIIDSKEPTVTISVTVPAPAGGAPRVVSMVVPAAAASGIFQACFNKTAVPGTYRVLVRSGGGGAQGTASFNVAEGFGPPNDAPVLGDLAVTFEHHIEGLVEALPTSPARADLQEKLADLRSRLATSLKEIQSFNDALKDVLDTFKTYPADRASFESLLQKLDAWQDKAKEEEAKIREAMRPAASPSRQCDDVAQLESDLKEVAGVLSELAALVHSVADFEQQYRKATGGQLESSFDCTNAMPVVRKQPIDPQFRDAMAKLDPNNAPVAFFDGAVQVANSAVAAASTKLFSAYCEQFSGPFSAHIHAVFTKSSTPWWSYDMNLEGTLTLRYEKAGSGDSQPFTGDFDGNVTQYAVTEDALRVLYPKLMRGTLFWHKVLTPGTPAHFDVPVAGTIGRDSLTLKLAGGGTDLADAENVAHVTYVVLSPLALAPVVVKFDLPYKNARFILGRAMSNAAITLPLHLSGKVVSIARDFRRTKGSGTATGTYQLSIKACNPGC